MSHEWNTLKHTQTSISCLRENFTGLADETKLYKCNDPWWMSRGHTAVKWLIIQNLRRSHKYLLCPDVVVPACSQSSSTRHDFKMISSKAIPLMVQLTQDLSSMTNLTPLQFVEFRQEFHIHPGSPAQFEMVHIRQYFNLFPTQNKCAWCGTHVQRFWGENLTSNASRY